MRLMLVKFVTFAVVSVLVLVVLANTMANRASGPTSTFEADFSSVSGLRQGDDVRAAGVKVGRVESIELHDDTVARVGFSLSERQPLTTTTRVTVRYQNLLGQRYLALEKGSTTGARLDAGARVPQSRTSPGFDLTALLNGFEPLFETLEPEQVNRLASSIIAVLQGEGGTIESLLTETAELTQDLADKDEVFGRVLDNLTPVVQNIAAHDEDFDTTVSSLQALMTKLAEQRTTIGGSIDGVSELADVTADLAADARPDLAADIDQAKDVSRVLAENRTVLAEALRTIPLATSAFARPMSSGSWLDIYLCNMAFSFGGSTIEFGSPDGPYSKVCHA